MSENHEVELSATHRVFQYGDDIALNTTSEAGAMRLMSMIKLDAKLIGNRVKSEQTEEGDFLGVKIGIQGFTAGSQAVAPGNVQSGN